MKNHTGFTFKEYVKLTEQEKQQLYSLHEGKANSAFADKNHDIQSSISFGLQGQIPCTQGIKQFIDNIMEACPANKRTGVQVVARTVEFKYTKSPNYPGKQEEYKNTISYMTQRITRYAYEEYEKLNEQKAKESITTGTQTEGHNWGEGKPLGENSNKTQKNDVDIREKRDGFLKKIEMQNASLKRPFKKRSFEEMAATNSEIAPS